jgi:peroxisomal 3,2-trans-enoyl-CoA isomerase
MSASPVSIEYRTPIAIITLNKPKRLNSLSKDEFYDLSTFLREADARPEVVVTLLIGTGRPFLCELATAFHIISHENLI